jgi:hypothetical protein
MRTPAHVREPPETREIAIHAARQVDVAEVEWEQVAIDVADGDDRSSSPRRHLVASR